MTLVFIGDVHGKMIQFRALVEKLGTPGATLFQLGDMALGFPQVFLPRYNAARGFSLEFIRGNHDSPETCRKHPNYMGDYGYRPAFKLFYLSGAFSIDSRPRLERMAKGGATEWWPDEELSRDELRKAFEMYAEKKPEIVISHECPASIGSILLQQLGYSFFSGDGSKTDTLHSRTAKALQWMFEVHKPKYWIFGHYHTDKTITLDGTTFHCCAELSSYEVEI